MGLGDPVVTDARAVVRVQLVAEVALHRGCLAESRGVRRRSVELVFVRRDAQQLELEWARPTV